MSRFKFTILTKTPFWFCADIIIRERWIEETVEQQRQSLTWNWIYRHRERTEEWNRRAGLPRCRRRRRRPRVCRRRKRWRRRWDTQTALKQRRWCWWVAHVVWCMLCCRKKIPNVPNAKALFFSMFFMITPPSKPRKTREQKKNRDNEEQIL